MNITMKTEQNGGDHILYVGGEVDAFTAPQLKERMFPLVSDPQTKSITVDLRQVSYIDSTGIGIFIGVLKASRQTGCQLFIKNVPPRIERIFRITGLHEIVPISPLEGEEA
jgi:anti-sigma B factor antagonist